VKKIIKKKNYVSQKIPRPRHQECGVVRDAKGENKGGGGKGSFPKSGEVQRLPSK